MKLQHTDPGRWKLTLKRTHLDTLMCATKWILEGQNGKIPKIALLRLKRILEDYNEECDRLYSSSSKVTSLKKPAENDELDLQENKELRKK